MNRSKTFADVTISATLEWDGGDSEAGIPPGWSENTCVEIRSPLHWVPHPHDHCEPSPRKPEIVTWVTWRDSPFDITRGVMSCSGTHQLPVRRREVIDVDENDPATWVIDSIETDYRYRDNGGVHVLGLTDRAFSEQDPGHILRLSELPEVLEVVCEVFEDWQAAERLSGAQESVYLAESYLDELRLHEEPDEGIVREAQAGLDRAHEEAQVAYRAARARGVA